MTGFVQHLEVPVTEVDDVALLEQTCRRGRTHAIGVLIELRGDRRSNISSFA